MNEFPIIEMLGGRDAVFERLKDPCRLKTKDAIRMWAKRGNIPGSAYAALWRLAEEQGIECRPADFELRKETMAS